MKTVVFNIILTIRPIAGPIGLLQRYRFFIAIVASIIAFLVLLVVFSIIKKIIKNRPKPVIYPDEIALKKLGKLKLSFSKKVIGQREFFIKLIDVLRGYIEKRYDIKMSGMTTEQFAEKMKQTREISKENKESVIGLLKRKDNITFAADDISPDELKGSLEFVEKFINNTKEER